VIEFRHAGALVWLVVAVAPVVIYLLLRRRKREVPWGASYLLRLTLATRRKASVWKQMVVLAVRVLVLVLAASLVARPYRQNPRPRSLAPRMPERPVHRVVLVDDSLSMSVSVGADSRLNRLRSALGALLLSERPGDTITLIRLVPERPRPGASGRRLLAAPFTTFAGRLSRREVREIVSGISLREGVIDLEGPLIAALSRFAATPGAERELYVLSDFPREIGTTLGRLEWFRSSRGGICVVPVNMSAAGESLRSSVSVRDVRIGSDLLLAGVPTLVYVDVQNFSDVKATTRLRVELGGQVAAEQVVSLQPDERKRVALPVVFSRAGVEALEVRADGELIVLDAGLARCVEVRHGPAVWLYADEADPREELPMTESEFLVRAIACEPRLLGLEPIGVRELAMPIPAEVDVVLLAGPRVITPKMGEYLTSFVRRGGGLVVAMSPRVDIAFYNDNLGPLLPAHLIGPARKEVDPQSYDSARQEPADGASELFAEFATDRSGELEEVRFYNHVLLEDADRLEGVVFRLTNGDPLLVHRACGRGHVYLWTSSIGASWSSLAVRQSFIPLIVRMINAAMAGRGFPRNLRPGESFVCEWTGKGTAALVGPDGQQRELQPVRGPEKPFVIASGLAERGLYELRDATRRVGAFAVIGQFAEPDLRTLDDDGQKALAATLGHSIFEDWPAAVRALGPSDSAPELGLVVLLVICALYLFETWFVRYL